MIRVMMMNGSGSRKTVDMSSDTKILDVVSNPEYSQIFVGNSFTLNGSYLAADELNKTFAELGCGESATMTCIKEANAAR